MDNTSNIEKKYKRALLSYEKGKYLDAIQDQILVINLRQKEVSSSPQVKANDFHQLGVYLYSFKDFEGCVTAMRKSIELNPKNIDVLVHLGISVGKTGQHSEALSIFEKASLIAPNHINLLDAKANSLGALGQMDDVKVVGARALVMKDFESSRGVVKAITPHKNIKPFNPEGNNIISFSLWGNNKRYTDGAIANVIEASKIYPSWKCYFYCDETAPIDVRNELTNLGARVIMVVSSGSPFVGLFWRFMAAGSTGVDRFLVRDADSIVNTKERDAVSEWLESPSLFHVMRDGYTHTELMLAGMWGGVGEILPMDKLIKMPQKSNNLASKTADQLFLRNIVWPIIRENVMVHDSIFDVLGAKKYPSELPDGNHIGDNMAALDTLPMAAIATQPL